jgi:peroxiredoxin
MQQVVDLQNSSAFQATGAQLISIATDPASEQAPEARALGIHIPMLVDDGSVTKAYGADQYAMPNGEPSHTFSLVDSKGNLVWFKDYGAPNNPKRTMYVDVNELVQYIQQALR